MIMPYDEVYQQTKLIMLGKGEIIPELKPLAKWIENTYGVKAINIFYDTIDDGKRPRLEVCFEFEHNRQPFFSDLGFDAVRQEAIAGKFADVIGEFRSANVDPQIERRLSRYMFDHVWVIYGAFEPIARMDANQSIPRESINELKTEFNNPDLWEISVAFSAVTFFYILIKTSKSTKRVKRGQNGRIDITICSPCRISLDILIVKRSLFISTARRTLIRTTTATGITITNRLVK